MGKIARPEDKVTRRVARQALHDDLTNTRTPVGSFHGACHGYERGFIDWLIKATPEGGTLAEALVSIAYDTYTEENDK